MGTEIYLEGCDLTDAHFVDHKCNILEDEEDLNCKLFPSEKGECQFLCHQKISSFFNELTFHYRF